MDVGVMTGGNDPVENNRAALKRILASLVAVVELGFGGQVLGGQFTFFRQKGAAAQNTAQAEKSKLSPALTLPRHLHRAVAKLLRPAEAAARRLIIAAARGLVVVLPPLRPRKPKPKPTSIFVRDGVGTGIVLRPGAPVPAHLAHLVPPKPAPRVLSLPLLDPLKNPFRIRRRYVPAHAAPRITWLSFDAQLRPLPPPPTPDDPIDAVRLGQRLAALGRALDDLPGQAKRFARWKARNDAALARDREARNVAVAQGKHGAGAVPFRRASPLRRGRPPGCRLPRYDPDARRRSNIRDIDEILAHCHALAVYALESPNTS